VSIKQVIEELRKEKEGLNREIYRIGQEIYQLQRQCTHSPEDLIYKKPRTLEPRWAYELAYSLDSSGVRVIETRSVCCDVCGTSWTEMRYTDSKWLESSEWEQSRRNL
jgi:hypothetical protein